jgi:hypothetical protein
MNYTSAAIGLVILLSVVTWFTSAAKRFTGPSDVHEVIHGIESPSMLQVANNTDPKVGKANLGK